MKIPTLTFDLSVDGRPVAVKATPYFVNRNMEQRFRVSYNGSPVHIFAWDESAHKLHAIEGGSEMMPDQVEEAIAHALQHSLAA